MARKQDVYTVPIDADGTPEKERNRDAGKMFVLTEMSALRTEKWAARALVALAGQKLVDDPRGGIAQLASMGTDILAVPFGELEPLLDEMLECVAVVEAGAKTEPGTGQVIGRRLMESDIEEITTLLTIRGRLVDLHTGFSVSGILARVGREAKQRLSTIPT